MCLNLQQINDRLWIVAYQFLYIFCTFQKPKGAKRLMKLNPIKNLVTIAEVIVLLLICGVAFGQSPVTDKGSEVTGPKSTTLSITTLTPEEVKLWQPLQIALDKTNLKLTEFVQTASKGEPKTTEEKALLWGDLETTLLRAKIEEGQMNEFRAKMREKYKCERCEFVLSADKQKVEFRPMATNALSISN